MRRTIIRTVLLLIVIGIAWWCFLAGRSYDVVLDNSAITVDGVKYEALEAIDVTIDGKGDPIFMLEGDRMVGNAVGLSHELTIELLDEDDKVIETRKYSFSILDLEEDLHLNVAEAYGKGK